MIATKKMNVSPVLQAAGDQAPMNSTSKTAAERCDRAADGEELQALSR